MRNLRWTRILTVGVALTVATGAAAQSDEFSDNPLVVRDYFEGGGIELKDWADGPVSYIMLDHERDEWKELDSTEHQQQFIEWFWARRDFDERDDTHEVRALFYERVAHANQRFREFPRGWRSDRGRVYISLGPPTGGQRRIEMNNWGRCTAEWGERWIYYTTNMAFSASMGEFWVIFVENGPAQFEICEPTMMGLGSWPLDVIEAMDITNEASVVDMATEFEPGRAAGRTTVSIRDAIARSEPLEVPLAEWGDDGVAGTVLVPLELPLRELLFEPTETELVARLIVDVRTVAMGETEGSSVRHEWALALGPEDGQAIAGGQLRTAVAVPAAVGGYSVQARVFEPISGTAWTWEGAIEVTDSGVAVSPPLVATKLARLRDGGEIATLGRATARLTANEQFQVVAWVRGIVPSPDEVALTILDASGNAVVLEGLRVAWGDTPAGPLVIEATAPEAVAGEYILQLSVGADQVPVETRVRIE